MVQPRSVAAETTPVDARQFGVEPDLPLDQSRALQRAIDRAAGSGGRLFLPAGNYVAGGLVVRNTVQLVGVAGRSRLISPAGAPVLSVRGAGDVVISGLVLDGAGSAPIGRDRALVAFEDAERLVMENCRIVGSAGNGVSLRQCSGRVMHNEITGVAGAGLFAIDSAGLEIAGNHVHDCADNGVLVWQSAKRNDGTIVVPQPDRTDWSAQRRVGAIWQRGECVSRRGRDGQRQRDFRLCWSAVRNNAGDNVQIVNNTCLRSGEVALYAEFGFQGAVINNNIVDGAGTGVSITNFSDGGRLAVCANNIIRNVNRRPPNHSRNVGIAVEADTVVSGNVVEAVPGIGYALGWGRYSRNISATGNIARGCDYGFAASMTPGAGQSMMANNIISGARSAAIIGMDHDKVMTGDLAEAGDVPDVLKLSGNLTS